MAAVAARSSRAAGQIILLGGTAIGFNGALLINNGTFSDPVNVNYDSLAKGTGTFGVVNVTGPNR